MNKMLIFFLWVLVLALAFLAIIFCFFFVGSANAKKEITWGVDFSQMQTQSLELDWKQVYLAIINDLGVKNIKLHTQWDWVQGQKNVFYFDDIDWQIKKAEENNVKIIYVVGLKSGRWPECHMPKWAKGLSEQEQKNEILSYIKQVVLRYKDSPAVAYWQVENEPFFKFGECPDWYYTNTDFIKEEVKLVKELDPSRQIIVSDSGEGSLWLDAAKIGDIVGTTMYREAWAHVTDGFGFYIRYFMSPVFYSRKALLIYKMFGKKTICVELQAEPWAKEPFSNVPLDEQYKTMNLQKFKDNIEYAKQTGFDTFYLWGAEWWYWLKQAKGNPDIWNQAKILFQG